MSSPVILMASKSGTLRQGFEIYSVAEAREAARDAIKAIKTGGNRNGVETFESVANEWVKRHVEARGLIECHRC